MGKLNLFLVTRKNLKEAARLSGRTEQYLLNALLEANRNREPLYVQVPLPKHLRGV